MSISDRLVAAWYAPSPSPLAIVLSPLCVPFAAAIALRRALYRARILPVARLPIPVVVVGNITVGGAGKTPLVAALAAALARQGFVPGVVSRGYGRRDGGDVRPLIVSSASDASVVGDEPLLLARAGFPVAVAGDRAAAAHALIDAYPRCTVVLCDDGLQHYALARDAEIAVIDGVRGLGNGWLLPAGPLREPRSRLASVDAVVVLEDDRTRSRTMDFAAFSMTLEPQPMCRVGAPGVQRPLAQFAGTRVHAVAGIGHPGRFFAQLEALGMSVDAHPFADHHPFVVADLAFADTSPVVMTEKDAVKCEAFADDRCWYLPVAANIAPALVERVVEKLRGSQAA